MRMFNNRIINVCLPQNTKIDGIAKTIVDDTSELYSVNRRPVDFEFRPIFSRLNCPISRSSDCMTTLPKPLLSHI